MEWAIALQPTILTCSENDLKIILLRFLQVWQHQLPILQLALFLQRIQSYYHELRQLFTMFLLPFLVV